MREAGIELTLPRAGEARVELYDAGGRRVRTLADGWSPAGTQRLRWDGRDERGALTAARLYFVRARVAEQVLLHRLVRLE